MSVRIQFVVIPIMLATLLTVSATRAQKPLVDVGGCAILTMLVYTEIPEAGFRGPRAPGIPVYPGLDETTVCNQTTRSVTAAYSDSLRQMNIHVSWGYDSGYNGEYCLSDFLSQCKPDTHFLY